jgi:hypothetical protein
LPIHDPDFDPSSYDDDTISADTRVDAFCLPYIDKYVSLTVREILEWQEALCSGTLICRDEYRGPGRTIAYIEPVNDRAVCYTLQGTVSTIDTASTVETPCGTLTINLISRPNPLSLLIADAGGCSDQCPPFSDGDQYVNVVHPHDVPNEIISAAIDSYLFELSATFDLDFRRGHYPAMFDGWDDLKIGQDVDTTHVFRLRPLNVSFGLPDLYQHFLKATDAANTEHAIINYVKVIEYVAPTVARLAAHASIRQRLLSKEALAPDAAFIDGLMRVIEDQRVSRQDAKLLKQALETCCDAVLLAKVAPTSLSGLTAIREEDHLQAKQRALNELSDCLTATRNQLAHAKVNYEATGKECPPAELEALAASARMASIQAIRWYAALTEATRVG